MKQLLLPWARGTKHALLKFMAERRVSGDRRGDAGITAMPCAFVVGCGRSGTTLVGKILGKHSDVKFYFEPYHLWATIDPTIDVLNRHHIGPCKFLLDEQHATAESKRRFNRLFIGPAQRGGAALMVEKTPYNACRIGYLEALSGGAKYIHLVRDGIDVARSIDRLSQDRTFRIIGMPGLNRWWGRNGSKWKAMVTDGIAAGYYPEELPLLSDSAMKGAYEWLITLEEIDRWRPRLGNRLLEITYDQLTADPRASLTAICQFLNLPMSSRWFEAAVAKVEDPRRNEGEPVVLPPRICESFNRMQARFNFPGRAIPKEPCRNRESLQPA